MRCLYYLCLLLLSACSPADKVVTDLKQGNIRKSLGPIAELDIDSILKPGIASKDFLQTKEDICKREALF